MKLVVLRSVPVAPGAAAGDEYSQEFDIRYAGRVLGNLSGGEGFCTACGPDCCRCRAPYGRDFRGNIAAVLDLPAVLPHVLERPWEHLPPRPPTHDVLLAVEKFSDLEGAFILIPHSDSQCLEPTMEEKAGMWIE